LSATPTRTVTTGPAAAYRNALQAAYAYADEAYDHTPAPRWAYALPATIPLVGAHYGAHPKAPRILLYASAEHIGTAEKDTAPWLKRGKPGATDRHPIAWRGGWPNAKPHTRVGIAPYEDGPLLAAAALLWRWEVAIKRATHPAPIDPVALTEHVAVANFSKFALPPEGDKRTNVDANSEAAMRDSLKYVYADIDTLKPTVVLVAKALTSALLNELTRYATQRGAAVIYTLQGSGQGPQHAGTHLERMGLDPASQLSLQDALGETAFEALNAFPGRSKDLTRDLWSQWFALLRARYDAIYRADGANHDPC
jgi:hypothetical protein